MGLTQEADIRIEAHWLKVLVSDYVMPASKRGSSPNHDVFDTFKCGKTKLMSCFGNAPRLAIG
jgi:hypothetical protein